LLLVDAENAFIKPNRKVSQKNIKNEVRFLSTGWLTILQDGMIQGGNAVMAMYSISAGPFNHAQNNETKIDDGQQVGLLTTALKLDRCKLFKNCRMTYRPKDWTLFAAQYLQKQTSL